MNTEHGNTEPLQKRYISLQRNFITANGSRKKNELPQIAHQEKWNVADFR